MLALLATVFILLQVGDAVTTIIALRYFPENLGEGNRVGKRLMDRFGMVKVTIAMKALAILICLGLVISTTPLWFKLAVLLPVTPLYSWVVWDNARLVRKYWRAL